MRIIELESNQGDNLWEAKEPEAFEYEVNELIFDIYEKICGCEMSTEQ